MDTLNGTGYDLFPFAQHLLTLFHICFMGHFVDLG